LKRCGFAVKARVKFLEFSLNFEVSEEQ